MAFFAEGREVQSFATYGGARRGTPVSSFIRVDDRPIRLRCDIEQADALLCFDASLLEGRLLAAAGPSTLIVVNSRRPPEHFASGAARVPRPAGGRAGDRAAKRARAHRQLGAARRARLRGGGALARDARGDDLGRGAEEQARERQGVHRRLLPHRRAAAPGRPHELAPAAAEHLDDRHHRVDQDRHLARRAAGVREAAFALPPRLPGGGRHRALDAAGEGGRLAWRVDDARRPQPLSRGGRQGLPPSLRGRACNRAGYDEAARRLRARAPRRRPGARGALAPFRMRRWV